MATLPNSQVLSDIIAGKKKVELESLSLRIFLGRVSFAYKRDPSTLQRAIEEFVELLKVTQHMPSTMRDIQKII